MPGGDRTGPMGSGPMTGRGAGFCAGYSMPGFANPVFGGGWFGYGRGRGGFGRGGGRGWRHWYYATGLPGWARPGYGMPLYGAFPAPYEPGLTPKAEMDMLKEQSEYLRSQLEDIQNRISTLEKAEAPENQ